MKKHPIKYSEGQWFAVPLRKGGYAIGIIVRGSYKTKGGLGYFFGPKYATPPNENDVWAKKANDAILISWFGDLGIVNGSWQLIDTKRPFFREEWPVPKFGRKVAYPPGKAVIVEYGETQFGEWRMVREIPVNLAEIEGLPSDRQSGGGSIEIQLTNILEDLG